MQDRFDRLQLIQIILQLDDLRRCPSAAGRSVRADACLGARAHEPDIVKADRIRRGHWQRHAVVDDCDCPGVRRNGRKTGIDLRMHLPKAFVTNLGIHAAHGVGGVEVHKLIRQRQALDEFPFAGGGDGIGEFE